MGETYHLFETECYTTERDCLVLSEAREVCGTHGQSSLALLRPQACHKMRAGDYTQQGVGEKRERKVERRRRAKVEELER